MPHARWDEVAAGPGFQPRDGCFEARTDATMARLEGKIDAMTTRLEAKIEVGMERWERRIVKWTSGTALATIALSFTAAKLI